jgi:trans-aconitate methyltransferase
MTASGPGYPAVEVVNAAFEDWAAPHHFDAVVAATSFQWLDPGVRLAKIDDALRPGGSLAVIATRHVAGGTGQFFADVQRCYEKWMPGTAPDERRPDAATCRIRTEPSWSAAAASRTSSCAATSAS